jgi:hypothetical protein
MRYRFTGAVAAAILGAAPIAAAAQISSLPRTADGRPNLQGIWQMLNTAAGDIQDHQARLGVPAGQSVVEGNEIPYRPEALAKKRQNFDNRATADPDEAIQTGRVDAQENPLAYMNLFRHGEIMKYVSITNHMWSRFNMLAHLPTWKRLPGGIQAVIERNVTRYVRLQRQDQQKLNVDARSALARRLAVNQADSATFRRKLSGVYASWKQRLGSRCWSLLEAASERLG